jgi:degradative hydroxymethylglutaryl-CoA reductase
LDERRLLLKEAAGVSDDDLKALADGLTLASANLMVENAIGTIQVPLGVATNFKINGRERLIPMATEEASVIAAASYAAKLALPTGFTATSTTPVMRGQMQLVDVEDASAGKSRIEAEKDRLIAEANKLAGLLPALGGGVIDLKARVLEAGKRCLWSNSLSTAGRDGSEYDRHGGRRQDRRDRVDSQGKGAPANPLQPSDRAAREGDRNLKKESIAAKGLLTE